VRRNFGATRCRAADDTVEGVPADATRAEWRVCSSREPSVAESIDNVGDAWPKSGELPESEEVEIGGVGSAPALPWTASMRTTDSQLFSRERTRSRSSSFSCSRVLSVKVGTTCGDGWCFERYMLSSSLSCLFSSSSSETRPFSCENCSLRRSREF
jgi:hypothetical protein